MRDQLGGYLRLTRHNESVPLIVVCSNIAGVPAISWLYRPAGGNCGSTHVEGLLARGRGAMHDTDLVGQPTVAPMHRAAIVPHDHISVLPHLTEMELGQSHITEDLRHNGGALVQG